VAQRVGLGWDIHRAAPGGPLTLGGVRLEADVHLLGHSDADALLHAVIDAMLGAAGLGDIGEAFPDTDDAYAGIASTELLERTAASLTQAGWRVVNVDATVIADRPKLGAAKERMRGRIADVLGIDADRVNVKAKTSEGLGPTGVGEAVEAQAVCLIESTGDR